MAEKEHWRDIISNKVDRRSLQAGDHIYTWRGLLYSHHGIYVGDEQVIHFGRGYDPADQSTSSNILKVIRSNLSSTSKPIACLKCSTPPATEGVAKSCLDCFLDGGNLYLYQYGVTKKFLSRKRSGTCTMEESDVKDAIVHRATYLSENRTCFGAYDVLKNNCEDFAIYCKTGTVVFTVGASGQANNKLSRLFHSSKDVVKTKRKVQVEDLVKINRPTN